MADRVVIVGGGVIGLAAARYCAARGMRVTLLDRGDGSDGCSHENAGMVVPSHFVPLAAPGMVALGLKWMWNPESPFYVRPRPSLELARWGLEFWKAATPERVRRAAPLLRDLSMASRSCFEELSRESDFGLQKNGLLMLCKTEHGLEEEARAAEKSGSLGIPATVLDQKGASDLDPGVTFGIAGAVYYPLDCHLDPKRFLRALEKDAVAHGAEIRRGCDVKAWRSTGGRVDAAVLGSGEVVEGSEFVICGGSWTQEDAELLGLRIPLQAGKGYSLTLDKPAELPRICSILVEARVAVTPIGTSLRVGGTMELGGMDESVDPRRVRGIVKSVPDYLPAFKISDFDGIKPWRGLRPCSPDGMPYLGRTKKFANLTVATGHAMMGLSLAPITGKLVSQILAGERTDVDLSLLAPERFD